MKDVTNRVHSLVIYVRQWDIGCQGSYTIHKLCSSIFIIQLFSKMFSTDATPYQNQMKRTVLKEIYFFL